MEDLPKAGGTGASPKRCAVTAPSSSTASTRSSSLTASMIPDSVVDIQLKRLVERLGGKNISLELSDAAKILARLTHTAPGRSSASFKENMTH
jgi:hypothetical protein